MRDVGEAVASHTDATGTGERDGVRYDQCVTSSEFLEQFKLYIHQKVDDCHAEQRRLGTGVCPRAAGRGRGLLVPGYQWY